VRFALVLVALGACYSPTGEATCTVKCDGPDAPCPGAMRCGDANFCEQPGGATCGPGGEVVDASPNPMVDASDLDGLVTGPCTPSSSMTSETGLSRSGEWFVGDHFSQRAMMFYDGDLLTFEGNFDAPGGTYVTAVAPNMTNITYRGPRLSLGGAEMYLKVANNGEISFGRSMRSAADKWSLPASVAFTSGGTNVLFDDSDDISPPTVTSPRRLMISSVNAFLEFSQSGSDPLTWKLESSTFGGVLFGVTFLGQASLSPDGLMMIFRGNGGANNQAYYVTRTTVAQAFGGIAVPLPHVSNLSVNTPFLSANCKHFYYTATPTGELRHVLLP
jgi:hypothetical protein